MEFTDRLFLAGYSLDAIAAALPAGIAAYFFIVIFQGTAGYVNVFVAQYDGSGQPERIGEILWQGIYFALAAAVLLAILATTGPWLFHQAGHPPAVQALEVVYFQTLMVGGGINVLGAVFAGVFSGRGLTRPVMVSHALAAAVNIPLDYCLINGIGPWPALGILGAGIATVVAWSVTAALLAFPVFRKGPQSGHEVGKRPGLQPALLRRLVLSGSPGAFQFAMDIFAFSFFIFMVGRIGQEALAVTNMVMSINALAFMPMMGFSLGTSSLVGNAIGKGDIRLASERVKATLHVTNAYVLVIFILLTVAPRWLLSLFHSADILPDQWTRINEDGIILLRIIAVTIFFDAGYMVFTGALKGAGDTRFIMWSLLLLSGGVMVLPVWIGVQVFGQGLFYVWFWVAMFILSLWGVTGWRYSQGRWRAMRVVDRPPKP
jgi:MATE family multidrug resistance protein